LGEKLIVVCGWVGQKVEVVLGANGVHFGEKWEKWEFKDGFRKLEVSDYKNL
jgi:hypothetical protein